jgi:hypothetical protein
MLFTLRTLTVMAFCINVALATPLPAYDSVTQVAAAAGASKEVLEAIAASNLADPAYKYKVDHISKRDRASDAAAGAGASAEVVEAIKTHNFADNAYQYATD